jgi:tetratricopeptide (TPR) repeat protein
MIQSVAQILLDGVQKHQNREFDQAAALYRQVLSHDSDNADAYNLLSALEYDLGNFNQAEQNALKSIALNPSEGQYYVSLAQAQEVLQKVQQAQENYKKAIFLSAHLPEVFLGAVTTSFSLGINDQALLFLKQGLDLFPNDYKLVVTGTLIFAAQSQHQQAIECYSKLLAWEPKNKEARLELTQQYLALNDYTRALEQLHIAIELFGDDAQILLKIAEIYSAVGATDKAKEVILNYLSRNPEQTERNAKVHCQYANILFREGKRAEAMAHYAISLQQHPLCRTPFRNKALQLLLSFYQLIYAFQERMAKPTAKSNRQEQSK